MVMNQEKDLEQAHICIGGPGISQAAPLRYASYVLNTALGGGMSSRLFQEVREKRGRVYSIYSFMSSFIDCGYFGDLRRHQSGMGRRGARGHAGRGQQNRARRPEQRGTGARQEPAQGQHAARHGIDRQPDEPRSRATRSISGREIPLEELANEIDKVTNDQVLELAATSFLSDKMALVLLGDLKGHKFGPDVFSELK